MPGRQGTSARQLPAQEIQQAPDVEVKFAQHVQHRDSHAAAAAAADAAADQLRPLDQQFRSIPGSGTALQPSDAMVEQKRASELESAQTGGDTSSEGPDGFASSSGEQDGGGSMLGQFSRQLSSRQQLELEASQAQQPGFEPEQAQRQKTGVQPSQQAEQQDLVSQQAQQEELDFEQASDSSEPVASSRHTTARGQGRPGESQYAARDLTVLEQYEADVVEAYASSFLAEAMLQQVLPATANAVVAEQHQEALAEVRYRNALNKQRHLDEVKAERAAWEEHEANIKRYTYVSSLIRFMSIPSSEICTVFYVAPCQFQPSKQRNFATLHWICRAIIRHYVHVVYYHIMLALSMCSHFSLQL